MPEVYDAIGQFAVGALLTCERGTPRLVCATLLACATTPTNAGWRKRASALVRAAPCLAGTARLELLAARATHSRDARLHECVRLGRIGEDERHGSDLLKVSEHLIYAHGAAQVFLARECSTYLWRVGLPHILLYKAPKCQLSLIRRIQAVRL